MHSRPGEPPEGLARLVGPVHLDPFSANRLRAVGPEERIVYALGGTSRLDLAALGRALAELGLPRPGKGAGVACLGPNRDGGRSRGEDPIGPLLDAPGPLLLVPTIVVWHRAPDRARTGWRALLLGTADRPNPVTRWIWALVLRGRGFVQAGPALALDEIGPGLDPERRRRLVTTRLRRAIRREHQAVRGPRILSHRAWRRTILDHPSLDRVAAEEAAASDTSVAAVRRRMRREFDAMAARVRWSAILFLWKLLHVVWTRIYSGVDVPEGDLEKIRQAVRDGTAILVISHRSHLDYLLLSWLLFVHRIVLPHIVAGANLDLPIVHHLLRGGGGFFIKRSFRGDRVFSAVFERYLRELVRRGFPIEFFIEGGRSRSGKLLPPRLGVLGRVLDAAAARPRDHEVTILPIALSYERVAEAGAHLREQRGEAKRPESLLGLLRSARLLTEEFGSVHLRVGDPLRVSSLVDVEALDRADPLDRGEAPEPTTAPWSSRAPATRRELVRRVGEQIVHRIGRSTYALPVHLAALSLGGEPGARWPGDVLRQRAERFHRTLSARGLPLDPSLADLWPALESGLRRLTALGWAECDDGAWWVCPAHRFELDFSRNHLVHAFAEEIVVAASLRLEGAPASVGRLATRAGALRALLARELPFDPEQPADDLVAVGATELARLGAIRVDRELVEIVDHDRLAERLDLLVPVFEAHHLVFRRLPATPTPRRDLVATLRATAGEVVTRSESAGRSYLEGGLATAVSLGVLTDEEGSLGPGGQPAAPWADLFGRLLHRPSG